MENLKIDLTKLDITEIGAVPKAIKKAAEKKELNRMIEYKIQKFKNSKIERVRVFSIMFFWLILILILIALCVFYILYAITFWQNYTCENELAVLKNFKLNNSELIVKEITAIYDPLFSLFNSVLYKSITGVDNRSFPVTFKFHSTTHFDVTSKNLFIHLLLFTV